MLPALLRPARPRSLIACTCIVYVQDTLSWTLGFAIPAAAMASAVLLFLAGSRQYR
jgi:dipeptide/tripeptide permease